MMLNPVRNTGSKRTLLIAAVSALSLGGWFGFSAWSGSRQAATEWRTADREMRQLLQAQTGQRHTNSQAAASSTNAGKSQPPSNPTAVFESTASNAAASAKAEPPKSSEKLRLNTATAAQLRALPGIGDSKANAIMAYRKQIGGHFQSVEQLLEVKGIGEKLLAKIQPFVTVEP
jgi:competence protein ComEA